jgi:phosphoribosylamine-glycine ligase
VVCHPKDPLIVVATGLAAGRGVVIAKTLHVLFASANWLMRARAVALTQATA